MTIYNSQTDNDGKAIINMPDGQYGLTATKDGYTPYSDTVNIDGSQVEITIEESQL